MELRRVFNNIISLFLVIAVFFGPSAHCLTNEIPSLNLPAAAFRAYDFDGVCQLLDLIETGVLDRRLNQNQIQQVNDCLGVLAIKGSNFSDLVEMQELQEDV